MANIGFIELDDDIIHSFGFWFIATMAVVGLMIGFSMQGFWGEGRVPFLTQAITLLLAPVAAYIIAGRIFNR